MLTYGYRPLLMEKNSRRESDGTDAQVRIKQRAKKINTHNQNKVCGNFRPHGRQRSAHGGILKRCCKEHMNG